MAQITLYLDAETEKKMKKAASEAGVSQSRWVAGLIQERTAETWPASLASLVGSWSDVPTAEEIRSKEGTDLPRETF